MKTGIIVLGNHSSEECIEVAERAAEYLSSNKRKNVRIAFHEGTPSSDAVMEEMNLEGTDTFVILPLAISEGKTTVWEMPKKLGLPDNCGSWRMMNGKDVATRFATVLGCNHALAEELVQREGDVREDTALLLISFGSHDEDAVRVADYYRDELQNAGWMTDTCYCRHGRRIEEALDSLKQKGFSKVRVIPLFVAFDGKSATLAKRKLDSSDMEISYSEPVSRLESFYRILDSKVPDGW